MKLIIEDDEGRKTVIPVVRDEITIGRNDANIVRLTEKNVSRKHGRLVRDQGHFYIEDLGSFTGIRVNGEKIKGKQLVREGDLIQISEYDLSLQASPDEKPEGGGASLGDGDEEPTLVRKQASATPPAPPAEAQPAAAQTPEEAKARAEAEAKAAAEAKANAVAEAQSRKTAETATIRLSDLRTEKGEQIAQEVPEAQRPKLIGISGTYRAKELVLDRSPIRLGRSEENDIEIDHPSISRRQCRLHLEGGTWKVMDAESRNGVRVNGEPYAAIGLRHGDILEIGHLRFFFAEPRKPFKLPAEFAPMQVGMRQMQSGGRTGLYLGMVIGLAVVLGAGAFFFLRHRGEQEASEAERTFALRASHDALIGHRYNEALRNLDVARHAGASADDLRYYDAVQAEARSEDLYREMESAASSQDWERARKLLNVLDSGNTFFSKRASEKADAITAGYVNLHIAAAGLMKDKDNAGCLSEAKLALAANPASADAQSLVDACRAPAVTAASAVTAPPAARSATLASRSARSASDDSEARKLVNEGDQKLIAQDFPTAIALYQKALSMKPGDAVLGSIYRSMGIAFTRQGNIEEGAHYYKLYLPLCTNPAEKAQLQKVLDDYEARRR
jgi:pSer/pThr/pTyr-binding forkhead associated (FHA) protein